MPSVLIWGASGGIGAALVDKFKGEGWQVYGAARNEDNVPAALDAVFPFEAAQPTSIEQVVYSVAQHTDTVDLVIYAAGGTVSGLLDKLTLEQWRAVMDANLNGVYYAVKASLNLLKDGHVMVLGAYVDKIMFPRMGAYIAAKAAIEPLLAIFQKENRKQRFTLVRLPAVDTDFWENAPFKKPQGILTPQHVADLIHAYHISGQNGILEIPHG